jgi:hypothetical protein
VYQQTTAAQGSSSATLAEAKVLGSDYRRAYNQQRLHSSLDYQTLAEFARCCHSAASAPAAER